MSARDNAPNRQLRHSLDKGRQRLTTAIGGPRHRLRLGWLHRYLNDVTDADVVGITLSSEQLRYAEQH